GPRCQRQDAWTGFAFSPDGKTVTNNALGGFIHFRDLETGREYARLQYPDGALTVRSIFSPEGDLLVAVNDSYQAVHVWDLRALGRELAAAGLDWTLPLSPPAQPQDSDVVPLQVTVLHADRKD